MVTRHSIMVQSGRGIQYKLEIYRKYTIIRGDSATGKTTLVNLVEDASIRRTADISCDVPCVVLPELNWEMNLEAFSGKIVFIDENHPALASSKVLAEKMAVSDNCFVIITRDKMACIPYSYKEIYQIKTSGKYHRTVRIYEDKDVFRENERYVTEDEAAGLQYYQYWLGDKVSSSHGNSNLSKYAYNNVTLIGDGAAIGPYMYDLTMKQADLYLPESFEWLLLHSPVFKKDRKVQDVLENPYAVITTDWQSWEEFFTEFLLKVSEGKEYHYSKKRLNPCYVESCCFKKSYCDGFTKADKKIVIKEALT